ncbi:hypothetical protein ACSZMV_21685, partial [Aeromonas veronii]
GFPELLTDDFSCHAAYVGVGIIRINSVLLAALRRASKPLSGILFTARARAAGDYLRRVIKSRASCTGLPVF